MSPWADGGRRVVEVKGGGGGGGGAGVAPSGGDAATTPADGRDADVLEGTPVAACGAVADASVSVKGSHMGVRGSLEEPSGRLAA